MEGDVAADQTGVTRLSYSERDHAAAALSRAFFDDPLQTYMLLDPDERVRLSPPFFNCILRHGQLFGEVHTTLRTAQAAAVWLPLPRSRDDAGTHEASPLLELPEIVGEDAMQRSERVMDFLDQFHKRTHQVRTGTSA